MMFFKKTPKNIGVKVFNNLYRRFINGRSSNININIYNYIASGNNNDLDNEYRSFSCYQLNVFRSREHRIQRANQRLLFLHVGIIEELYQLALLRLLFPE